MVRTNTVPQDLDWVEKRAACTAAQVFHELRAGIESDVERANQATGTFGPFIVTSANDGRTFIVSQKNEVSFRVIFFYLRGGIEFQDEARNRRVRATLTLNEFGRCVLKVDEREIEQWQFRKMALEDYFFGAREE